MKHNFTSTSKSFKIDLAARGKMVVINMVNIKTKDGDSALVCLGHCVIMLLLDQNLDTVHGKYQFRTKNK